MTLISRLKLGIAATACMVTGSTFVAVGPTFAIPAPSNVRYSDAGPEAQLARIFENIDQNRLDIALKQVEDLTRAYPHLAGLPPPTARHLLHRRQRLGVPIAKKRVRPRHADLRGLGEVRLKFARLIKT